MNILIIHVASFLVQNHGVKCKYQFAMRNQYIFTVYIGQKTIWGSSLSSMGHEYPIIFFFLLVWSMFTNYYWIVCWYVCIYLVSWKQSVLGTWTFPWTV